MKKKVNANDLSWTEGRVLQSFAFCNVFPEDDTVSIDIDEVLQQCGSALDQHFTSIALRLVNKSETVKALGPLSVSSVACPEEQSRIVDVIAKHG